MFKIIILTAILTSCLLAASGCSSSLNVFDSEKMVVIQDSPEAIWSMRAGREYMAEGRYELAREQYLNALAASQDQQTKAVVSRELETVDLMIKAQR